MNLQTASNLDIDLNLDLKWKERDIAEKREQGHRRMLQNANTLGKWNKELVLDMVMLPDGFLEYRPRPRPKSTAVLSPDDQVSVVQEEPSEEVEHRDNERKDKDKDKIQGTSNPSTRQKKDKLYDPIPTDGASRPDPTQIFLNSNQILLAGARKKTLPGSGMRIGPGSSSQSRLPSRLAPPLQRQLHTQAQRLDLRIPIPSSSGTSSNSSLDRKHALRLATRDPHWEHKQASFRRASDTKELTRWLKRQNEGDLAHLVQALFTGTATDDDIIDLASVYAKTLDQDHGLSHDALSQAAFHAMKEWHGIMPTGSSSGGGGGGGGANGRGRGRGNRSESKRATDTSELSDLPTIDSESVGPPNTPSSVAI